MRLRTRPPLLTYLLNNRQLTANTTLGNPLQPLAMISKYVGHHFRLKNALRTETLDSTNT